MNIPNVNEECIKWVIYNKLSKTYYVDMDVRHKTWADNISSATVYDDRTSAQRRMRLDYLNTESCILLEVNVAFTNLQEASDVN